MKRTIEIKTPGAVRPATSWLLVPILLSALACAAHAQWTRLALEEGGVGEDLQLLRGPNNALSDTVWSANMEGGLFRSEFDVEPDEWINWTEYLPGRSMFGVEAICDGEMEYVLGASGDLGLWYAENPSPSSDWDPPNGYDYPASWDTVWTHDAAFFCNTDGSWPDTPQDSFFVILSDTIGENPIQFVPGIYRWLEPDNSFYRVDGTFASQNSRDFGHFWRDLEDGNVLYVTSPDGIYKLYGSYTSPKFEKLPPEIKFEDLPIARPPAALPPLPEISDSP